MAQASNPNDREEEFAAFCRTMEHRVWSRVFRAAHGNETDAQDAFQVALIQANTHWTKVSRLAAPQQEKWLAKTAARHLITMYRKSELLLEGDAAALALSRTDPTETADPDLKAAYRRVVAAISKLPDRLQEVAVLHFLMGYETAEVARMMGITRATLGVHVFNIRRRLEGVRPSFLRPRRPPADDGGREDGS